MFDLAAIQAALREFELDGWLLCDFRGSNLLARRVLELEDKPVTSRRWYYCIPADGEPRRLVHRIEQTALDHLPGTKTVYLAWQELEAGVARLVADLELVAMEYSPRCGNPYVSRVDAGTVELVRAGAVDVVSSGDLVQMFEAVLDDDARRSHLDAAVQTDAAFDRAWRFIAERIRAGETVNESDVQAEILRHFVEQEMTTSHPPIVAVNAHSGDPHYETGSGREIAIREGDFVLIDLWAKFDRPNTVYSDLTRVGYAGESVPEKYDEVFRVVAGARDAAIELIRQAFAGGHVLEGWQVDEVARSVIEKAGRGEHFVHRTGHSIGQETHGNGANMDNLETHETRRVLPGTCFSIEPGIYLPEFGIRSEVNVLIDPDGTVHVTGGVGGQAPQSEVLAILGASK